MSTQGFGLSSALARNINIPLLLLLSSWSSIVFQTGSAYRDYHPCTGFIYVYNYAQKAEFSIRNDLSWLKRHPEITNCTYEINFQSVYAINGTLSYVKPLHSPLGDENCNFKVQLLTGHGDRAAEEFTCSRYKQKVIPWPWNRVIVNIVIETDLNRNKTVYNENGIFVISTSPMNKHLVGRLWTSTKIKLPEENNTSICIDSNLFYYYIVYNEHWPYGKIHHDVMVRFQIKHDVSLCIKSYSQPVTDHCQWNVKIKRNYTQLISIGCTDVSDYWCLPWSLENSALDIVWAASVLQNKASVFSLRVISNNSQPFHEQGVCPTIKVQNQQAGILSTSTQSAVIAANNLDHNKESDARIEMHVYIVTLLMVILLAILILISLSVKVIRNRKRKSACNMSDEHYNETRDHSESHRCNNSEGTAIQQRHDTEPPRYTARWTNTSYMEIPNNDQQLHPIAAPSHGMFYNEDPPLYTSQDNLNVDRSNIDTFYDDLPTYNIHFDHSNIPGMLHQNIDKPPPYDDVCR